jgi:predicted alpha/beta hydrolase family esterase
MHAIILPGIGGSGEGHWQSIWQRDDPAMTRIQPENWDSPVLSDWIEALDTSIRQANGPVLLIAHSLGCLLVAHWAVTSTLTGRVGGAFLVAVPDPHGPAFPASEAATFLTVPDSPLPFPALMLASSDDPYGSMAYARRCAQDWRAGLIDLGPCGHINAASGLGAWPQGAMLRQAFEAGVTGAVRVGAASLRP